MDRGTGNNFPQIPEMAAKSKQEFFEFEDFHKNKWAAEGTKTGGNETMTDATTVQHNLPDNVLPSYHPFRYRANSGPTIPTGPRNPAGHATSTGAAIPTGPSNAKGKKKRKNKAEGANRVVKNTAIGSTKADRRLNRIKDKLRQSNPDLADDTLETMAQADSTAWVQKLYEKRKANRAVKEEKRIDGIRTRNENLDLEDIMASMKIDTSSKKVRRCGVKSAGYGMGLPGGGVKLGGAPRQKKGPRPSKREHDARAARASSEPVGKTPFIAPQTEFEDKDIDHMEL